MRLADLPPAARMAGDLLERACPWCRRLAPTLQIHAGRTTRLVPVADVTLLRASCQHIEVWTAEGLHGLLRDSLARLEAAYPGVWTRVHRRALVDLGAVLRVIRTAGRQRHAAHYLVVAGVGEVAVAGRLWPGVKAALVG